MPNIKSAKKRVRVIEKKTLINMAHKTALKTAIKKFEAAAKAGNKEEAQQLFNEAANEDVYCVVKTDIETATQEKVASITLDGGYYGMAVWDDAVDLYLQERSHSLLLNLQNLRKSHLKELQFCSSFFCT